MSAPRYRPTHPQRSTCPGSAPVCRPCSNISLPPRGGPMPPQYEAPLPSQTGPTLRDRSPTSFGALLAVALVAAVAFAARGDGPVVGPGGFRAMIADAVARMHAAMDVPFSGEPDRDFAHMMIPHHQGAIDMALVELRYGKDERLKRLAQEIIVEQQQEIALMHLALGDALPRGAPAPTQVAPVSDRHQEP